MAWIRHDSGDAATIKNSQVLGTDSPLETDDDGYAEVGDEVVDQIVAMHGHVDHAKPPDTSEEFDAEAFVDRTPMDDVVEDLESGEYDAHLDAIEAAESDGRDREGVTDAIADRREE